MTRKILLIASAIIIPLGATAVTVVAEPATAGAAPLAITCHFTSGVTTFASPGLSLNGSVSASPTSTSTTTASGLNCGGAGTGTGNGNSITSNSTPCTGTNLPAPGCALGLYNYDSVGAVAANATTLWMQLPKIKFTIAGTAYQSKSSSSNFSIACASGEAGFIIKGKLTKPLAHAGETTKVQVCLGSDTGPGTTGVFAADLGVAGVTIATANVAADSKIKIA